MIQNSILFDIGGTKTRIAISKDESNFSEPIIFKTPSKYQEGLELFVKTVEAITEDQKIDAVCGGIAGLFNKDRSTLLTSPNLPDWIGKSFKGDLEEKLGVPIYIENDSAIVGLGEANFGAGKGFDIVAYITVSTGVGGARIVGGKIDEKALGFEPGHQIIDLNPNKTLEELISGKALTKKTGKHPKEITDPLVWDEHARLLAFGLNNVVANWSPDCIVLGGSMIVGDPAIPVDKTREYLIEIAKDFPKLPEIKKAELKDFGGLWGALSYLKNVIK